MGRKYKKKLTTESHYKASIMLYDLLNGKIPDHIDWEIKDEHITMLKMFIIEGMNPADISRTKAIISKRGKPMDRDMISLWLHRYLPFMEYDEKVSPAKRNRDPEETRAFYRLRRTIPKTPCVVCGSTKDLELDHILTYYAGGKSEVANLQWLCHKCHQKKTQQENKAFGWSNKGSRTEPFLND